MTLGPALALLSLSLASSPGTVHRDAAVLAPDSSFTERIPPRRPFALTGSEFLRRIAGLTGRAREKAVLAQLMQGNVPPFLRQLRPVTLSYRPRRGGRITAVIWVMPDYLAIGADDDFLRIPIGLPTAIEVSRRYGFVLPTRKMVDAIYRQSDFRLAPRPMRPGVRMTSSAYFGSHNRTIEKQLAGRPRGELVSGHKKDLILTRRLVNNPRRVAIYGWHQRVGHPIQPVSTVHGARYADYSHGVRLVSTTVLLNGEPRSIFELLRDGEVARVLTYEGVIREAERLIGPRPVAAAALQQSRVERDRPAASPRFRLTGSREAPARRPATAQSGG